MDLPIGPPKRVKLLGGKLDMVTASDVLRFTDACTRAERKAIVANHNAHSLALTRREPAMQAFYEMADIIEIDSMPVIAWGRALGLPISYRHRCTYLDWRDQFWNLAEARGWRVFYLGGAPGVAEVAARKIMARWNVEVGSHHGYFDQTCGALDADAVIAQINAFAPDVLFVGLGMPLQERWIARNFRKLLGGVVFSVGGAFDYEAGVQPTPPRWTGRAGLEWLYRLSSQPRRLFARYCIEPWSLAPLALQDLLVHLGRGRSRRVWEVRDLAVRQGSSS